MAPTEIVRRQYGYSSCNGYGYYYGSGGCYYSSWNAWGRWVLLAAILIGSFLLFFIFSVISARRRRRAGMNPYRFTGWAGGQGPPGQGPYDAARPPYGAPQGPPAYGQPGNAGGYYGNGGPYAAANQGYFGGQQTGVELQQPHGTYQPQRGVDTDFAPPQGPPPGKKA